MDIDKIQAIINPLLGQKAWGVSLGHGSFLTLEFGQPLPLKEQDGRIYGEWHLWVYCCSWRLEEGNKILTACEDERAMIALSINRLEGLTLESFTLLPPAWDIVFTFEHQVTLRLFAIYPKDCEHWFLYAPDDKVLCIGPGSSWSYENSSETPT